MKRFLAFAVIVCSLSLPAFAAKNSADLTIIKTVNIGTTQLPAGDYKVTWTGTDANVQISIVKSGKTVATAPAKLVPTNNKSASGVQVKNVNGVSEVQVIQLNKMDLELQNPE